MFPRGTISPVSPAHRFLCPEEVIQKGDEFWTGSIFFPLVVGHWHPCESSIGCRVDLLQHKPDEVRRPL